MSRQHDDQPTTGRRFIPAMELRALDRWYDSFARVTGTGAVRRRVIERMGLGPDDRVLDLGCGTGTLLLQIKAAHPGTEVVGVDPDADILSIAAEKARRAGVTVKFEVAFADRLPLEDASFDGVVSTLAFHHLTRTEKEGALREAFRVLRPGGLLHIADLCQPRGLLMRAVTLPMALGERTADSRAGRLPWFMSRAGFVDVSEGGQVDRLYGTVCIHHARRPAPATGGWRS
jgi:ubiquinone/menaquinone biosynthesis C-methylase UbiE